MCVTFFFIAFLLRSYDMLYLTTSVPIVAAIAAIVTGTLIYHKNY